MSSTNRFILLIIYIASAAWPCPLPATGSAPSGTGICRTGTDVQTRHVPTLPRWKAGQTVDIQKVEACGVDRWFTAQPIDDATFQRMYGRSYKKDCTVPRSQLRLLHVLHWNEQGQVQMGEMVCHSSIAADLVSIFRALYEAHYPISRMMLVDDYGADDERSMTANNTSCFNFRRVAGTKVLSKHSRGLAVDINPLRNPMVKPMTNGKKKVSPAAGRPYADRSRKFSQRIDHADLCYRLFTAHGFKWGGDWKRSKDYQHFEK